MPELEPANHRDRVAASGVDLLLVLLVGSLTLAVTGPLDPSLRLGLLLFAVGLPTFLVEGVLGRSLGKAGLQLNHGEADAGAAPLSIPQAAGRFVLKWLLPSVLVALGAPIVAVAWWIALYLPALGPTRRTAHDRLTRTKVLGPTDEQRAHGRAHDI